MKHFGLREESLACACMLLVVLLLYPLVILSVNDSYSSSLLSFLLLEPFSKVRLLVLNSSLPAALHSKLEWEGLMLLSKQSAQNRRIAGGKLTRRNITFLEDPTRENIDWIYEHSHGKFSITSMIILHTSGQYQWRCWLRTVVEPGPVG
jgi:hypothetical protein